MKEKVGKFLETDDSIQTRFHQDISWGKRQHNDIIKDIANDSQVNSHFPYMWSPASLMLNVYFYLFSIFISNKMMEFIFV